MKLIANENFQFQGIHRAGVVLTVPENVLKKEIERGRHPVEIKGRKRWLSGLVEHCTPANDETADFISSLTGETVEGPKEDKDEKDDAKEIREIRAEFDLLGKAYNPRLGVKKLRLAIIKARKEVGEVKEEIPVEELIAEE